jgi:hypothetical protein
VRLYFAGNVLKRDPELYAAGIRNRLLTFADIDEWGKDAFAYWLRPDLPGKHVFIDCGAYSVLMRGAVIDRDRYCEFARANAANVAALVALDVVGDPVQTAENLRYMEAQGLSPMPVYTASAPLAELERLCERYRHLAIGGMRGREAGVREWQRRHLDRVFAVARRFWPVKFHVFGITAQWVLERYPVYSADSSAAIVGSGMGRLLLWQRGQFEGGTWKDRVRTHWDATVADIVGAAPGVKSKSAHLGRTRANVSAQLAFERYLTDLWADRGVTWQD